MEILIFRHAERLSSPLGFGTLQPLNSEFSGPPLSPRGVGQARQLAQSVSNQRLPLPKTLWCSPKLRAYQTFRSLSEAVGLPIIAVQGLDEREDNESPHDFRQRISSVLDKSVAQQGPVYMVSHQDWVEECLFKIPSDADLTAEKYQSWAPGQYIHFEIENKLWKLKQFGVLNARS